MSSTISNQTFATLEAHLNKVNEKRLLLENEKRHLLEIKNAATKENVQKIALPLLFVAACILQQQNATNLTGLAYTSFFGYRGWAPQAMMTSAYLALKGISYYNQKTEGEDTSITDRVYSWIKDIPSNFATGISCLPTSYALKLGVSYLSNSIFNALSMNKTNKQYTQFIAQASVYDIAVKGPFLEELFFREVVQSSFVSAMKIVNLTASRWEKDIIFSNETINTSSRIFSATLFGLVHANQSLPQAVSAGIGSYFYYTWLYEKNGLFGSFGLHAANNLLACWKMGKMWG